MKNARLWIDGLYLVAAVFGIYFMCYALEVIGR